LIALSPAHDPHRHHPKVEAIATTLAHAVGDETERAYRRGDAPRSGANSWTMGVVLPAYGRQGRVHRRGAEATELTHPRQAAGQAGGKSAHAPWWRQIVG
jgi:hypothetical protein